MKVGIWWSPDDVSASVAALRTSGLIEEAAELSLLGEGFGSLALESENGVVVLVCKNEIGAESRRVSTVLLPELAPALPVAVPQQLWSVDVADGLPWGAWACEKLPGRPMTNADCLAHEATLGHDIASFLSSLHAFPAELAIALGVPSREAFWAMLRKVHSDIDDTLRERLTLHEYLRVQAWWDAFATDEVLLAAPEAPVHGDLWPDNMLVSEEDGARLSGVLDWGDATVLDIAYDFAPLHHAGDGFATRCLEAYVEIGGVTDPTFEHRVRRYRELGGSSVFSLRAAVREDDEAELQDCIAKLRSSAVLA